MDIPSIASVSAMQAAMLQQQIQIAVLAKANQTASAQGDAAIALLEAAAEIAAPPTQSTSSTGKLDVTG